MYLKIYLFALAIFVVIDGVWLTLIARKFYADQLGSLMTPNVKWVAAILFYLLFIAGLAYFVILPAVRSGRWDLALLGGLFFGLVTYATYDLTNLATLTSWPIKITIVDLIWGTTLGGIVSTITYFLVK